MSFIEFGFPDKTDEFDSRAKGPRISQRDSHPGDYFVDGVRQKLACGKTMCCRRECSDCYDQPVPDATGFPYDDNTAGEALTPDVMDQDPNGTRPFGGHPQFYEILEEMKNLYSAKHYQYATDADPMINFRLCGSLSAKLIKPGVNQTIAAALLLMSKQIVGVYEIVGEGKTNTIESLQDKLRDIGIYSVILQILVGETQQ